MNVYRKPYRVKRKKSIFKNRFLWLTLLLLILIVSIPYFLIFSSFFQIEKIIVSGNEKILKENIQDLVKGKLEKKLPFSFSKSIFLVNLNEIKVIISDYSPQVAEVEISRDFPDALNITLKERVDLAVFCQDYNFTTITNNNTTTSEMISEKCFLLDKEGIVFEETSKDYLILLKIKNPNLKDELKLGERVVEKELFSKILDLFSELENLKIPIKEILIVGEDRVNVKTLEGWEIYFNPQKDSNWQLTKLKSVLKEEIPIERRKDLEYIELRFGNFAPFKYQGI